MNILIVTSIFPNYDTDRKVYGTPFLFPYAKNWAQTGHKVTVIHLTRVYPAVFNVCARLLAKIGIHSFEKFIIPKQAQTEKDYTYEGVRIRRMRYRKWIPHGVIGGRQTQRLCRRIISGMEQSERPALILGDFFDVALNTAARLREHFGCTAAQTLHASDYSLLSDRRVAAALRGVGLWLLRAEPQKAVTQRLFPGVPTATMYSGITEDELAAQPCERSALTKLLYVGRLIKSKGLDTLLDALALATTRSLRLQVVGDGADREYFQRRVQRLGLDERVSFTGAVPHEKVFEIMAQADALVLISQETFGMVYVEAMAQSCIPIAARGEGIDGIVRNGENGYLVGLNDPRELAKLFDTLQGEGALLAGASRQAYATACDLTQTKLARQLAQELTRAVR